MSEKKEPKNNTGAKRASTKKKRAYQRPTLKRHNDIASTTEGFSVGGPPVGGPSGGATASPVVPGAVVF